MQSFVYLFDVKVKHLVYFSNAMKRILLAWLIFIGGFLLEVAIDYALRMQDGEIRTSVLSEPLWFLIQWVFAAIAIWLLYTGTNGIHPQWKRLIIVSTHAAFAFFIYLVIGFYYIVGMGIDSL